MATLISLTVRLQKRSFSDIESSDHKQELSPHPVEYNAYHHSNLRRFFVACVCTYFVDGTWYLWSLAIPFLVTLCVILSRNIRCLKCFLVT